MSKTTSKTTAPVEHITQSILILRGRRVLLDAELADLTGATSGIGEATARHERPPA